MSSVTGRVLKERETLEHVLPRSTQCMAMQSSASSGAGSGGHSIQQVREKERGSEWRPHALSVALALSFSTREATDGSVC